jgi:hypothetical protein
VVHALSFITAGCADFRFDERSTVGLQSLRP